MKTFLKKIIPSSRHQVSSKMDKIENHLLKIEKELNEIKESQSKVKKYEEYMHREMANKFDDTNKRVIDLRDRFVNAQLREMLSEQNELIRQYNNLLISLNDNQKKNYGLNNEMLGFVRENNWALIFDDTINNCDWLQDKSFSLGRWAIGYQCAYVLFRILDEIQPKTILELGLGQSTKLIGQYAYANDNVTHYIVEHDQSWIDFFQNNYEMVQKSNIVHCDWEFIEYEGAKDVRVFADFQNKFAEKKFGLIMIDAPFGGDMTEYSRIDVLRNITEYIEESFIIMIDDIDRDAELNTYKAMHEKLLDSKIACAAGVYRGKKSVGVIVSEDLKFVLTM